MWSFDKSPPSNSLSCAVIWASCLLASLTPCFIKCLFQNAPGYTLLWYGVCLLCVYLCVCRHIYCVCRAFGYSASCRSLSQHFLTHKRQPSPACSSLRTKLAAGCWVQQHVPPAAGPVHAHWCMHTHAHTRTQNLNCRDTVSQANRLLQEKIAYTFGPKI